MIDQINNYYSNYNEDSRLIRDNAHLPEYLISIHYFDKHFIPNSNILDVCAGTGRYAFYLAEKGHTVTACDLVEHNIDIIKSNHNSKMLSDIRLCNALDLSYYQDNTFDIVLCMGALYHLATKEEKEVVISECIRVCKTNGIVVFAYISKIGASLLRIQNGMDNIQKVLNILDGKEEGIFRCTFPVEIENIAQANGANKIINIGTDGMSQLFGNIINASNEDEFKKYMEYLYRTCEDENILGTSLHCLYFGKVI